MTRRWSTSRASLQADGPSRRIGARLDRTRRPSPTLTIWIHRAATAFLVAEFLYVDATSYVGRAVGGDARIYLAAARAWLAGGDPWAASDAGVLFAAPPP